MRSHRHQKTTSFDTASLFDKAYMRVANIEKGVSGFSKTSIYPFNKDQFTEVDFSGLPTQEDTTLPVIDNEDVSKPINDADGTSTGERPIVEQEEGCNQGVPTTSSMTRASTSNEGISLKKSWENHMKKLHPLWENIHQP